MSSSDERLRPWIELVGDQLLRHQHRFPREELLAQFANSIDAIPSWNYTNPDGSDGFVMLVIPYVEQAGRPRTFVLSRTGDFPDDDLDLVRRLQPRSCCCSDSCTS